MDEINNKRTFGTLGEEIAIKYLEENNYKIITKNYRVGRSNEIDIIAREAEYICFIEVKTRSNNLFGSPAEAVTKKKQKSIIWMTKIYLKNNKLFNAFVRFDVIEIILSKENGEAEVKSINLIKNAFIS
jgi:putative endonuclease